jgi:hypothetical protein
MKNYGILIVALLIVGAAGYFLGRSQAKERVDIRIDTVSVTQEVKIERVVYRNLPGTLDTVAVLIHDTLWAEVQTARIDTVLMPYRDTLNVTYLFPPVNRFNLLFAPAARPVEVREITKTITQYEHDPWMLDVLKIGGGIGIGYVAGRLSK